MQYVTHNYMLLRTNLTKEIGRELYRYVTLVDPACNQFEYYAYTFNFFVRFCFNSVFLYLMERVLSKLATIVYLMSPYIY